MRNRYRRGRYKGKLDPHEGFHGKPHHLSAQEKEWVTNLLFMGDVVLINEYGQEEPCHALLNRWKREKWEREHFKPHRSSRRRR